MDWLQPLTFGLVLFAVALIGQYLGYRDGFREGQERERVSRRIDELTGTERL